MSNLIKTELIKIRSYPVFWILTGLYIILLILVLVGIQEFIDQIFVDATRNAPIPVPKISIYKFPDIWHNLTYIASARYFMKVILGVIIIILITNEYTYKTIRANIITGMSRNDFIWAKFLLILFLSLLSAIVLLIVGLYLGFRHTDYVELSDVFKKADFLLAYFIEVFTYLTFAFLIGLLMKRAGLAIGLLFLYTPIEEFIKWKLSGPFKHYLPVEAMNHIIMTPKTKLMTMFGFKFQENISLQSLFICLVWAGIFILLSFAALSKRDL